MISTVKRNEYMRSRQRPQASEEEREISSFTGVGEF